MFENTHDTKCLYNVEAYGSLAYWFYRDDYLGDLLHVFRF